MAFEDAQTLTQLVETGLASRTLRGEFESGDLPFIKTGPWGMLAAVIDGLGHGPEASAAARLACATLEQGPHKPLWRVFKRCHEALKSSRGVAMTVAYFSGPWNDTLTWAGVGNVEGVLLRKNPAAGPARESIPLRGGVVGFRLPPLRLAVLPVYRGDTLILATDGIRGNFADGVNLEDLAQMIAESILKRCGKETDDALVLTVRYWGRSVVSLTVCAEKTQAGGTLGARASSPQTKAARMTALPGLRNKFLAAFEHYLCWSGEAGLLRAYELGREAIEHEVSLADLTSIYADALANALLNAKTDEQRIETVRKGAEFLAESLAPFEMVLRGHQEANQKLRQLNETLEQRVAERTTELTEANRLKDGFLMTVSHELRTPLTAIVGWAARLSKNRQDPKKMEQALEAIQASSKAEAQIIEDLLDVSRIITGKLRLHIERLDMAEVINAALDVVRPAAEAKKIHLKCRREMRPEAVSGDPVRLRQVIWNLLANAVKFTPEGGRVETRMRRNDGQLEITVSDTGIGISPEFLPNVFDRFRQADSSSTRKYGGLGLGLALVRHLVELHGGQVRAESSGEGQGAAFTVRLPIAQALSDEAASI